MATTLLEARELLSPYVDNGVCSSDSRVILKINEAQRRLHSQKSWLGVLARFSVGVNANQFTLPASLSSISTYAGFGLESANRVTSTTAQQGFITNSVQAYLCDSGDVVSLNFAPASSDLRTYSIEGTAPAFVEVTGKLNYKPALLDTDLLIIDDVDALKLMILAIFREENNQLDMAQTLENKAIERLTVKLDMALEAARRLNYQTRRNSFAYGTLGYVRSKLALDINQGLRIDDQKLIDVINKAQDLLIVKKGLLLAAGRYGVKDGLVVPTFTYVTQDSATLAITDYDQIRCGVLSLLADPSNEKSLETANAYRDQAFKQMEEKLIVDLETKRHLTYEALRTASPQDTFGYVRARLALDLPNGLKLSPAELGNLINNAEEKLFALGKWYGTIESYKIAMTTDGEIFLPPAVGQILTATMGDIPQAVFNRFHDYHANGPAYQSGSDGFNLLVDRGEEYQNGQLLKKYFVRNAFDYDSVITTGTNATVSVKTINVLAKKRWLIKTNDSDRMDIRNYSALKAMVQASLIGEIEPAERLEKQAIDILKKEISEQRGGLTYLQVQSPAFGFGEVTALI
jgi:hypothetical protein